MKLFSFSLLLIMVFSCSNIDNKRDNLIDFVPKNSSIIIKVNNLENLKSSINNSDLIQRIAKTDAYRNLEPKLKALSYLNPTSDVLICFSKPSNHSVEYTVITKYGKDLFITDSLPNFIEETLTYENKTITKSTIDGHILYSTIIDSTFLASSSKAIIDSVFELSDDTPTLEKLYSTTSDDKTFSIILSPSNALVKSFFIEDALSLKNFTEYIVADVEVNQNDLYFNGITKAIDSAKHLINIFRNTIPQINQVQQITPSNSDGFMSFTFDDFSIFKSNLNQFNKKDSISSNAALFKDVIEIGVIYEDENRAIVLNSTDVIATNDALLSEQDILETYREIEIYKFTQPLLFAKTFAPLITFKDANIYCELDNFFVFANTVEMLQNIITNYQNRTTLSEKDYFQDIETQLSNASSWIQVSNPSTLKTILDKNFNNKTDYTLSAYNASAIQFIYDHNFAHVNAVIKRSKSKSSINSVSEELNIKLDKDLLTHPQFVKNHITNEKDIAVQDVNNNLYLISNTGKILWKKQLQGPILGTIEQIDVYKNGRLQLAFATPNRVYVMDRDGNDVAPFPLKFSDAITQPLSVFDYDKRKNYRLMVTQDKNILLYDANGKTVKGFTFKSAEDNLVSQPKHFRIGSKDYLALKTANKLYLLDRTGKSRITPKTSVTYSNQPVFLLNDTFTTTTQSGDLISVDTKGNVATKNLNLSEKHHIETTTKTLVTQSENKLFIKNKTTELDFGDYSAPKLFYIQDKIYVSTTDLQSHKVYLFDSQSEMIPNFPIYGNSSIELDNIDKDRNLEFVVKGESNSIILYQIN